MGIRITYIIILLLTAVTFSCTSGDKVENLDSTLLVEGEVYFKNIRQLTFGGENAEAYFSTDNKKLIFQSTREPFKADQIFTMNVDGSDTKLVSTGKGRTTCAYYYPGDGRILYASTHLGGDDPPPPVMFSSGKYVWPVYDTFDIFSALPDGSDMKRLTDADGYDAEATIAPDGTKIVFTSTRDNDIEIYTMNLDGADQKRLTHEVGYDGGAFFSFDSKKIVYRAQHSKTPEETKEFQDFLAQGLVQPTQLDVFIMDTDGSNKIQVTDNGKANFGPFFHPDGKRIIFYSNIDAKGPRDRNFDLYMINTDGTGLRRITFNDTFDEFPMFIPDGKTIVFASNRNAKVEGETNVFIADFVDYK